MLAWATVALFTLALAFAVASWIFGGKPGLADIDEGCESNPFGCNVAVELLGAIATVALAFLYFASWRIKRVVGYHLEDAADEPWRLLPTATRIDRVVGRSGVCEIIERELVDQRNADHTDRRKRRLQARYRPQVLVGGVGDGKTAVLIRLTQLLSQRGAVPIPIALRDAKTEIDFVDLARRRFTDRVSPQLLSGDEGDKIWRELCGARLLVILADGLEEALPDMDVPNRVKAVRLAIAKAADARIPLVITTRPNPVLAGIDVAVIRLEPLAAHQAIDYIHGPRDAADRSIITRVARAAEVMERPLYLKLARDLCHRGKLDEISSKLGLEDDPVGAHGETSTNKQRVRVRFELLEHWRQLLVDGQLQDPDVWIDKDDREKAVATTQELACVALAENRLEIDFQKAVASPYSELTDARLPAAKVLVGHAEHLDLVELVGQRVRFRHSILQAYLGAHHLPTVLKSDGSSGDPERDYLDDALAEPGRELTMALVMLCLVKQDKAHAEALVERLCKAAASAQDHHAFELLAAAYEIDTLAGGRRSQLLKDTGCAVWSSANSGATNVETTEAKLAAIQPIAEAGAAGDPRAYQTLWEICAVEDEYAVRFQAAQAFASGGNDALAVVRTDVQRAAAVAEERLAYRDGRAPQPEWEDVRKHSVLGWVMPLLAVTCDQSGWEPIRETIASWVRVARRASQEAPGLHLGVEAAFAHGFEWAANRRADRDHATARDFLIDQALALLDNSGWWHTRITLLQALTLWGLESEPRRAQIRRVIAQHRRHSEHPFVREAASLCRDALPRSGTLRPRIRDRHSPRGPSRHIWIDEVGLVAKIGPEDVPSDEVLHIPPSVGWHALSERARYLVAEVLVFLNLIEGSAGNPAAERSPDARNKRIWEREERRLSAYRQATRLPPCLTCAAKRHRLGVDRVDDDSVSCPNDDCLFGLCPHPRRHDTPFRGELPEIFCREQERLVRSPHIRLPLGERRAFWTRRAAAKQLTEFWANMENRDQR